MAKRFQCKVSGVDITEPFVEAANKLTALLRMEGQVKVERGDGQRLPYPDSTFDGGYTQHVTMNVADRPAFFAEAYRVLKPGAVFALTEHGLGPKGDPRYPLPWSMDGSGAYLVAPSGSAVLKGPTSRPRHRGCQRQVCRRIRTAVEGRRRRAPLRSLPWADRVAGRAMPRAT
jgi:SAM-dependent methyltransferase